MPTVVDVLLPLPLPPFRYLLPADLHRAPVGSRAVVPWHAGVRIGVVSGYAEVAASGVGDVREVIGWLDATPHVSAAALEVTFELAEASATPAGAVLGTFIPVGLRDELVHEVSAVTGAPVLSLLPDRWTRADALGATELEHLRRQGLVFERVTRREPTVSRLVAVRAADAGLSGKARENQRQALETLERLESCASAAELAREAGVPDSAVRLLVNKGYAEYREFPEPPPALPVPVPAEPPLEASPIARSPHSASVTVLSGGTRRERLSTLLPMIEGDIANGSSVLLLAPEGAYLNEAASLLASRVPVAFLSGELTDRQRERVWEEVSGGTPLVLVTTYLGLFAPFPRLGRVIVIEAGSGGYKLQAGARTFVPAAARLLARANRTPLVLADVLASPEMLSWGEEGEHLELPIPEQRLFVSDLATVSGWPLGSDLVRVLKQVRDRGRQAILLAPRRGFSAAIACQECGHSPSCPNCDLALRYHRGGSRLRCHQCGFTTPLPDTCPNCGATDLAPGRAAGTEWVAEAVARLLPDLTVYRHDGDRQDDLQPLFEGEPGVLVATTSVLRLAPLPNVSLVALTLLDTHLNMSDFRAGEESLRLILQLRELAPARRPLVLIQTFQPGAPLLTALTGSPRDEALADYRRELLERRRKFGYPPFGQLAKVQVSARDRSSAEKEAGRLASALLTAGAVPSEVLGPVPAPVTRVRGRYAYLVYLRSESEERFRELLRQLPPSTANVRIRADVDPRDVAEFLE